MKNSAILYQDLTLESRKQLQYQLKRLGIRQALRVFKKYGTWQKDTDQHVIKWGDQIEGHFLTQSQQQGIKLCLDSDFSDYKNQGFQIQVEYGKWMFELIPSQPYSTRFNFKQVIQQFRHRYNVMHSHSDKRLALTVPSTIMLGVNTFDKQDSNQITQSKYVSDKYLTNDPYLIDMTKNCNFRRGKNVQAVIPIFKDLNTKKEQLQITQPNPQQIYTDALVFGPGMSCLQCTSSSKNLSHATYLHDQINILSPLMLALTAASPFYKGKVSDWDARWKILEQCNDFRNQSESDPKSKQYIPIKRCSPASLYLWDGQYNLPNYNDLPVTISKQTEQYVEEAAKEIGVQMDINLKRHIAHIFEKDYLNLFKSEQISEQETKLFQIINKTNWNSVKLKFPTNDQIGWTIELKTMDIQPVADENAAFSLLIHFFVRMLHKKSINFYLPISLVAKNFDSAVQRDAARNSKFFFRTNIFQNSEPVIRQLTLDQIFFGLEDQTEFAGLFNLMKESLNNQISDYDGQVEQQTKIIIQDIQKFIRSITTGKRPTLAQRMREYVDKHPNYRHNSILDKKTIDDILITLDKISKGQIVDEKYPKIFSF